MRWLDAMDSFVADARTAGARSRPAVHGNRGFFEPTVTDVPDDPRS
jgi:hypothetical protein